MTTTPTEPTEPTADPLADLLEADAEALEGEQLAIAVARIRYGRLYSGYGGPQSAYSTTGDGAGLAPIPRPDRDAAAAVALFVEMLNRRCNDLPFVTREYPPNIGAYRVQFDNHDAPYASVSSYRGGYQGDVWGAKEQGKEWNPMEPTDFCLLVTRAYFRAWQEEKRAERRAVEGREEASGGN